jgi:fermentation-respiration switch protein FrsA (DUF1100 family)
VLFTVGALLIRVISGAHHRKADLSISAADDQYCLRSLLVGKLPAMKWRKILRVLGVGSLLGLIVFVVVAWIVGGSLIASTNCDVGPPPADLSVVATTIASDSGSRIATWYIPTKGASATIVLLHPIRGTRRSMLGRARLFHDAGYSIVMVDLQAHGESAGESITLGHQERHDVVAAIEFAREKNPQHRIGVVGRSLGGAAALLGSPLDIDALVVESVYPTISEAVHNRIAMRAGPLAYVLSPTLLCQLRPRLGISLSELRPIDHIAECGCPVLVASGERDRHTSMKETQRLYEAANEPKQLAVFKGAGHINLMDHDPEQYTDEVLGFLNTYLIVSPPAEIDF